MRIATGPAIIGLCVLLGGGAPACGRPVESIAGGWETVISSPVRPWNLVIFFSPADDGWTGTMSAPGLPEFRLRDIRLDGTQVHFIFPPEFDSWEFEGVLREGTIEGAVPEDGTPTPTLLTRIVPLPPPAGRLEAWRQDIDDAGRRMLAYDRSFTPEARERFRAEIARIRGTLPHLNDAEILVELSSAVALAGNAHTRVCMSPTRDGTFSTTLPIRTWWFDDGLYVIRTAPAYRRALGAKVVAVGGYPLPEARGRVDRLFAGNSAWSDYLDAVYMTTPDFLQGAGLIPDRDRATFTLEDRRGKQFEITIQAEPVDLDAMPDESWQELSPVIAEGSPKWETALPSDSASIPLYLRHPDMPYWFEFLPDSGLLYVQMNRSTEAAQGPSFAQFGASLLEFAATHPVQATILDLRFASGGDLTIAKQFVRGLSANETIDRQGRLFVVVGRCTFSAGLYHAAQLKAYTHAVFVGTPVGDDLDFWAEGGRILLPNSRAAIAYSNGFHRYSGKEYPDRRPYYEALDVKSLAPDISAPLSSEDYLSGRDPALEAIEARLAK